MRRRRSTRKPHLYKRKSKKTKRHVKRHVKRRNYRGGGRKVDLKGDEQIPINRDLIIEEIYYFYLGKFTKRKRPIPIPFYIKFPKMFQHPKHGIQIPYYLDVGNYRNIDIELYWSSIANPNYLDRKISDILFHLDNTRNNDDKIYDDSMVYDNLKIHKSIISKIRQILFDYFDLLTLYPYDQYQNLESK